MLTAPPVDIAPVRDRGRPARPVAAAASWVGAVLVLAGDAYHLFVLDDRPTQVTTTMYRLHGLAILTGLLLLVLAALALAPRTRLTAVSLPALLVGSTLVVGDIWAEVVVLPGVVVPDAPQLLSEDIGGAHLALVVLAYAVFAAGWVLYALSARRWAAPAAAWLLVVGGVLAFLPIGGSYVLLAVGAAAVALTART